MISGCKFLAYQKDAVSIFIHLPQFFAHMFLAFDLRPRDKPFYYYYIYIENFLSLSLSLVALHALFGLMIKSLAFCFQLLAGF